MDGQGKQPPNKSKSNGMPFNHNPFHDDLFLNECDIKQEVMVKDEPIDTGDNVVSISYAHVTTGPLSNPINAVLITASADFNELCDLIDIKSVIKDEEVTERVNKATNTYSEKDEEGKKSAKKPKPPSIGKKAYSNPSSDDRKKSVAKAKNMSKSKVCNPRADKKQHKCSSCEYTAAYKSLLKRHTRKHTGDKPFPCSHCLKQFTRNGSLQQHLRTHVAEFLFSCSNCLKGSSQLNEKLEHEVACNVRRYECDLCKKYSAFKKTNLKIHMRVHTGDRPFRCDQCLKKFNQQSSLRRHMKTHTNPRPPTFNCSICYRSFTKQTTKDVHEENCMRRGYECYLCKCFNSPNKHDLMYHMRAQHTGDKQFRCEICAKCFLRKGKLNRHKKIHKQLPS